LLPGVFALTAWKKLASKRGACDKTPVWQQFHNCRSLPG
jgi:hypothetical protein